MATFPCSFCKGDHTDVRCPHLDGYINHMLTVINNIVSNSYKLDDVHREPYNIAHWFHNVATPAENLNFQRAKQNILQRVKSILNLPPSIELVDTENNPLEKICMPHSRCLPECIGEGGVLSTNDRCCEGLIAGNNSCYDPLIVPMEYPDEITDEQREALEKIF